MWQERRAQAPHQLRFGKNYSHLVTELRLQVGASACRAMRSQRFEANTAGVGVGGAVAGVDMHRRQLAAGSATERLLQRRQLLHPQHPLQQRQQ